MPVKCHEPKEKAKCPEPKEKAKCPEPKGKATWPEPKEKATWDELRKKYRISMKTPPKEVIEKHEEIGWKFSKTLPDPLSFGSISEKTDVLAAKKLLEEFDELAKKLLDELAAKKLLEEFDELAKKLLDKFDKLAAKKHAELAEKHPELAEKHAQFVAAIFMLKAPHMVAGVALNNLIQLVYGFAFMNRNILFIGEPGTGKEFFADFYQGFSMRKKHAINCAGIIENTAISKLFGHLKGAFTGANGNRNGLFATTKNKKGFIFLDELGAADEDFQAQLLRVMETGDYQPLGSDEVEHIGNIPVCAATSDPDAVRQDLRDRFIILYIPPLRDHSGDIPAICRGEWENWEDKFEKPDYISGKALELLKRHSWPDNIRGLLKTLRIAADLTSMDGSDTIRLEHLPTLCDCEADSSRKLKISGLKPEGFALPREAFFKPFRSLNQVDHFSLSPDQYKKAFYQHFKNYKASELHRDFPDIPLATIRDNLKKVITTTDSTIS